MHTLGLLCIVTFVVMINGKSHKNLVKQLMDLRFIRVPRGFSADNFLVKYGYLEPVTENEQHHPEVRVNAIRKFQQMNGLRVTGRMNQATRRKMRAPRCGNADIISKPNLQAELSALRQHKPLDYHVPGYRWRKNALSWAILNTSPDMTSNEQRSAFTNAFKYWSDVSGLKFAEKSSADADITIAFASGNHGDGPRNAFDRKGGVLAHAFYPEVGRIHFDEAEDWSASGAAHTTHLQTVAAHELGHALGIGHSEVPQALMAPYYQGYDPEFRLHEDDIQAIQLLYGAPSQDPSPTPTPVAIDPGQGAADGNDGPNMCTMRYDAIVKASDGGLYVFKGNKVWKLNAWAVEPDYPVDSLTVFEKLPDNIGAAVYSPSSRYTYFFKGHTIYRYYGFFKTSQMTISGYQYPSSPQAAFLSRDNKIYVLQGQLAWEFDEQKQQYTGSAMRISEKWPGLPGHPEAAVRLQDGFLYVIKGQKYRKYDEFGKRTMKGYPKDKAGPFMGPACGGHYVPK